MENTRKTGKSLCISIDQVLYDLGVDLGTVHGKTPADRGFLLIGGGVKERRQTNSEDRSKLCQRVDCDRRETALQLGKKADGQTGLFAELF